MRAPTLPALALLLPCVAALGCGDSQPTAPEAPDPSDLVTALSVVSGSGQEILAGRRSPDPFRVRAEDGRGDPVEGAVVEFSMTGRAGGILSQPRALTDPAGMAETYLLEAHSGVGLLTARAGGASTGVGLDVTRAPGELRFEEASGAVGLPAKVHPDSLVRVQLLDTEGAPLEGTPIYFAGPPGLSRYVDTTDSRGWASTVVRRAAEEAGDGLVFAFVLGFPEVTVSTPRPVEAAAKRVVLVSVDGLRADALARWDPPTLTRLAAEGAFTDRARTVVPSLTVPAHLSLFASVPPEEHGIFGDDIEYTEQMASLDPLFRSAQRRGKSTEAFLARDGPLQSLETALKCKLAFGLDSLTLVDPGAARVAQAAAPAMADDDVDIVFVHLSDPGVAGHTWGWESPEYGDAVLRADAALGTLVAAIEPGTLLVVTSDHGGGGAYGSHQTGSDSDEDVRIPLILWGPRVVAGSDAGEASILDVAPTVLWALGLRPPVEYEGDALVDAFR